MCHGGSGPRGRCRVYRCFPFRGKGIGGQFRGGHRRLVEYAHTFRVKVYVTVNTILKDEELPETERLVWALYRAGVDALIVQDMALLELDLPPIPLHASTQMDNRTPEKVKFLHGLGFSQVVLARELSLAEIQAVHAACDVPLEVFVHGALCVSYSGQCYVSQHCFGRSANRGECAQFCRLKFDMVDSDGRMIEQGRHLLSLKDMNRGEDLERLLDAGVTSLKIEGRLKDVAYVKKRDCVVPQPFGRNLQTPSGVPPGFIGAGLFGVHTLFGEKFQPRIHPLFSGWPYT